MSINVISVGARGPLGLSSLQLALSLRAAKLEPRSLNLLDRRGREIGACITGGLPGSLYGYWRMVALAAPAVREAARGAGLYRSGNGTDTPALPLVLCLPEPGRPDDDPRFESELPATLAEASGVALDAEHAHIIRCGHSGGAFALQAARKLLDGGASHVVVGGVDTYYHPAVLEWLDAEYRLHALDAEDGIIPSEGAAFAVLSKTGDKAEPAAGNHAAVRAKLSVVATGREETIGTDEPNIGAAVTELMADLQSSTGGVQWVLSDVNGERHRVREWSMLALRLLDYDVRHDRFAGQLGDIGAAFGPTLLAVACQLWRRGVAPAPRVAIALHSDGAERGVFALEAS